MNANRWYIRVYHIWFLLQTLYSRNKHVVVDLIFFPESCRTLYFGNAQREREKERERREWRRIRNHNLFTWWDKERLNQFTARDFKIRQDGPVCFFVCRYVFHIKYNHIIPRSHAADTVGGLQKLRVPRIRVHGNTRGNNRQEFEALRSLLVENTAYYWNYKAQTSTDYSDDRSNEKWTCHLQLGMSHFSLFRDRLFVGLYRGIISAFRTGEFVSDSRPYIISKSSLVWYYCVWKFMLNMGYKWTY